MPDSIFQVGNFNSLALPQARICLQNSGAFTDVCQSMPTVCKPRSIKGQLFSRSED